MTTDSMTMESDATLFLGEAWFDPIEAGIREQIRGFIEGLIEEELTVALGRRRYERGPGETASSGSAAAMPSGETAASPTPAGYRHGHRERRLCGSFGRSRSPCRGRGSVVRTGGDASGRARCCPATPA